MVMHYKTIVISDIHLGTSGSKAKEVTSFLKHNSCDELILNGDIIDGWQLKKFGAWKKHHTKFFKSILRAIEKYDTKVIYLRGNHDDFLDTIIPFRFGNISVQKDYIITSGGKKFYVVHGDVFDSVTTNLKWIAKLGDIGYTFLLWLNQRYNNYRMKRGLPYYSLSQAIKSKVKKAISYISEFENEIICLAKVKKCDGIICGHIHQPAIKNINGTIYMNSGDWVESLSALVEDFEGTWSVVYYSDNLVDDIVEEEAEEARDLFDMDIIHLKAEIEIRKRTITG